MRLGLRLADLLALFMPVSVILPRWLHKKGGKYTVTFTAYAISVDNKYGNLEQPRKAATIPGFTKSTHCLKMAQS